MPSDLADVIRSGYAGVRFAPTYEEVTARQRGRLPVTLVTAIAVLVVALGAGALVRAGAAGSPTWLETFAADCDRVWTELARDNPALTPQHQEITPPADHVFAFHNDLFGLRLYVFDPVLFACSRSGTGEVTGSILGSSRNNVSFLPERGEETLNFLAAVGVRPEYIIGRVPRATTGVMATTQSSNITATIGTGFFAAWAPGGGLDEATVVADRTEGGTLKGRPTALIGPAANVTGVLVVACRDHVFDRVREIPGLTPSDLVEFEFRTYARDGDWGLVVFASPRLMTACELTDAGILRTAANTFTAPLGQERFSPLSGMFSLLADDGTGQPPDRNWAVVAVPPGTQRGEFVLAGGRVTEGRVDAGFMIGLWSGVGTGIPTIRAYTVDTVYEKRVDKPVTTRPR